MAEEAAGPDALGVREVQQLVRRKDELEAQIKACYAVLEGQKGVGMNEPLVDAEGYPRADVDVYQVRAARHNIICLQNDHKALMLQVEKALHQLHAREKEKQAKDEAEAQAEAMNQNQSLPQPFARVNAVTPGSPASISGLQVDDEIIEFGSVDTHNFQTLQNIATVVQHSEGKPLSVTVIRGGKKLHLGLTPKHWAGKGLLGCNILPLQR
ncbi:26S proteasome non-ATPase regulatory subunit 9 isoform X1 [Trachemys scripta elegans]|uniref:26S proteasome non-ATPase regulatory subunit 9 n=1 Tax=Malaclemys terrapin pileata TaxID=2991368 RepID=UPI001551BE75|nr:26S proteasome non-ATPase regulatory subunit 9 isoform X1 [Trachemys scripta elegans]XP_053862613.1 26S proteasome non-ATPase regulatory subunit 9 [Malaclemys terrapin pileata]